MTDDRSLDRAARSFLEPGPTRAPEAAVEAALRLIQTTPQERDLRILRRLPTMSLLTRLAGAAVVAVVAVGAVFLALRPPSGAGSAQPIATPGATAPATASPTGDPPLFPASPFPDPAGNALPSNLIGRIYRAEPPEINDGRQLVLTLRGADDPHCLAMYGGRSTCFTVLWAPYKDDPGARGSARIVGGNLVLGVALAPFDLPCVGQSPTYTVGDAGATLRGIDSAACLFQSFVELPGP